MTETNPKILEDEKISKKSSSDEWFISFSLILSYKYSVLRLLNKHKKLITAADLLAATRKIQREQEAVYELVQEWSCERYEGSWGNEYPVGEYSYVTEKYAGHKWTGEYTTSPEFSDLIKHSEYSHKQIDEIHKFFDMIFVMELKGEETKEGEQKYRKKVMENLISHLKKKIDTDVHWIQNRTHPEKLYCLFLDLLHSFKNRRA